MAITPNQGLILPDGTDNANVPLTFTDFVTTAGSGMENRLVQRYLSIADRTARNGAPNEGELSYLADLDRYESYTGVSWVTLYPQTAYAFDNTNFNTVSVVYTTAGGPLVGATVVVPLSGQVRVDFSSILDNTNAGVLSFLAPQLNNGAVIGGGATITAAADAISIRNQGQDEVQTSSFAVYTGLTPGTSVNAFLNHRVSANSGAYNGRKIILTQA